ncbi:hypothetical protein DFQ26_005553 [Actinomortierella ambigua]|nr:hypothetical protein DFQ26_005553 [Actinomortierella ambigua]
MLTLLHTLANTAGLLPKDPAPAFQAPPDPSEQLTKALANVSLVKKIILTQHLDQRKENAALASLHQITQSVSLQILASLKTIQLEELASTLTKTTNVDEILSTLKTTTITTTTTTTKTTTTTTKVTNKVEDDNVSVTSSEGPLSAVTVVDDDSLSLTLRSKLALGRQASETSLHQLFSGNLAVEHVSYALSDLVFVYPSTSTHSFLGASAQQWSHAGISNAKGSALAPQVLEMSTRANAAAAIQGAVASEAAKNDTISTLASSAAILNMVPNLYQLAQSSTPVVFHVAAEAADADLNVLRGDYSDVLVARETGLVYLASNTVQEAYDISILAHAAASGTAQSVIHVLDGVQTSHQVESINTVKDDKIASFVKGETRKTVVGHDESALVSGIEAIFERASTLVGRTYKAFEYTGPANAETVVVVFGPAANVAHNLGSKVGVLNVRLYRPWSFSHFLKAVPQSAKKIVVVEPVSSSTAPGPLFLDVSASLSLWTGASKPKVVDVKYGHYGSALSQGWLKAVVEQTNNGEVDLAAVVADTEASHDNFKQAIFWETATSAPVSAHVAKHLSSTVAKRVQHSSRVNSFRHTAVVETRVQLTTSATAPFAEVATASYAAVQDASILEDYDVLDSLEEGAILLVNTPWTADEAETKTSPAFRLALGTKQIRLLLIDLDTIAKDLGLAGVGKTLLGEIAVLKTFSSNYREAAFGKIEQKYDSSNNRALKELITELVEKVDKEVVEVPQNPNWLTTELTEEEKAAAQALPKRVVPTIRGLAGAFEASKTAAAAASASTAAVEEDAETALAKTATWHQAAFQLMFGESYATEHKLSDDHHYVVQITEHKRLTPTTYDRYVFHLEMDTLETGLKYEIGDALGIHGWNDTQEVLEFIEFYGEKPESIVVAPRQPAKNAPAGSKPFNQVNTLLQVLQQQLDLFGRPSKRFYADLIRFATNPTEKERLEFLISAEGAAEFKDRVDETLTHADILREFPSAHPSVPELLQILPPIKPRHYSIASSQKAHPNSVHLLIVAVDWVAPSGKQRFGQCTRYLTSLKVGDHITVSIKPSVMTLPPEPHQPVIMAGLGTGMAPFRAFIQERAWQKEQGLKVGPMILYFGSRNRANEYLYGEELEAYNADGLLTHLRPAFSRDQKQKVYIQHRMNEDGALLHEYLLDAKHNGHFYLCGPTWPAGDVKDAIVKSFMEGEQCALVDANRIVNKLKEEERYVLEVY